MYSDNIVMSEGHRSFRGCDAFPSRHVCLHGVDPERDEGTVDQGLTGRKDFMEAAPGENFLVYFPSTL